MELIIILALAVIAVIEVVRRKGFEDNPPITEAPARKPTLTISPRVTDTAWKELRIGRRHPGSDWVYLPKVSKDNECKLVSISETGQREAAEALVGKVKNGYNYLIELEREPSNPHDPNAIKVLDTSDGGRIHVGYIPRDVAEIVADRYAPEMPIRVMVKRAIQSPEGRVFLRLAIMIPKKSLRREYEL